MNKIFLKIFLFSFLLTSFLPVFGLEELGIVTTNIEEINKRLLFLDKLSECSPHKYHAVPSGIYEIKGKLPDTNACKFQWTIVDCKFPDGVYQEFSRIQKIRTLERAERAKAGLYDILKDKNYRYIFNTGNLYCTNRFSELRY